MIKSVSNVTFGNKPGVMDKVSQEQLNSPGEYTKKEPMPSQNKQKGGFLSFLVKAVLAAAIVTTGLILTRRYALNKVDVSEKLSDGAKPFERIKYDLAKAADWLEKHTIGLFRRKK